MNARKIKQGLSFLLPIYWIVISLLHSSCQTQLSRNNTDIQLHSLWQFRKAGSPGWYPAQVPGSLISDLWRNKKIGSVSEEQIQMIAKDTWEYKTYFHVEREVLEHDFVELCFDGLQKNAFIYLNDSLILKTDNWFTQWKIKCKSLLKNKDNKLLIIFKPLKHPNSEAFSGDSLNKLTFPGLGILKPVYLRAWSLAIINGVFMQPVYVNLKKAGYTAEISITSAKQHKFTMEIMLNNKFVFQSPVSIQSGDNKLRLNFEIERPKLWWPNGMGNPYLYQATVRIKNQQEVIHEKFIKLGVRSVESTNTSNGYFIKINGVPMFLKGAGYTPSNLLKHPTNNMYKQTVDNAILANFNILRLQNDGLYENETFYNLCDENGLLIWHDIYIPPYLSSKPEEIERELGAVISQLRSHACMGIWSDGNQTDQKQADNSQIIADLVNRYSPHIPYLHSLTSSSAGNSNGLELYNGHMKGNIVTGYGIPVLGPIKFPFLPDTVAIMGTVEDLYNDIKTAMQDQRLYTYISKNYPKPKDFDAELYLARLSQAAIMKSLIENHRRNMPRCMGSVYAKLNDQRFGVSSSTISYSGHWNPAHYAVRNAFSHILVIPAIENNSINIFSASDASKEVEAFLLARLIKFTGEDMFVKQMPVTIKPNTSSLLLTLRENEILKGVDRRQCCLVVQINQANKTLSQNILYFTEPKNLALEKPSIETNVNETAKGYALILKSPILAKNVYLETISKTAWFTDNNMDLLPGKRTKINVRYPGTLEELVKDLKIKSLFDLKK